MIFIGIDQTQDLNGGPFGWDLIFFGFSNIEIVLHTNPFNCEINYEDLDLKDEIREWKKDRKEYSDKSKIIYKTYKDKK